MDKIQVYDKKWCRMYVDLTNKRLEQHWHGFTVYEQFKEGVDMTRECFRKYDLVAILSDTRHQQIVSEEEKEYAVHSMTELQQNGLKWMAFVMPLSEPARILINEFKAVFPKKMIRHFDALQEAEEWLSEKAQEVS